MSKFYLSLGGNIGKTETFFRFAISRLRDLSSERLIISPVYTSKSWGFQTDQDFLNCCVLIDVDFDPLSFLEELKKIETEAGRSIKSGVDGYTSRVLDVDIIYHEGLIIEMDDLIIPHPQRLKRNFVLHPLADIAPDYIDPLENVSVEMLKNLCTDEVQVSRTAIQLKDTSSF